MLKKPNILVVGSFMMDLIVSATRVPKLGETVIGTSFNTAPGGKGVNQAVQCARLGASVTMAGCVGDDSFGREMLDAAAASGVDTSHVLISKKSRSGVGNIQLEVSEHSAQNRIIVVPGANYDLSPSDLKWLETDIKNYDLVMLQLELTMEVTKYVANVAAKAGIPVMLNPAPAAKLDDDLLSNITYLSPNEHEAALLTGHAIEASEDSISDSDLNEVLDLLHKKGVDKVMITLGSNGSILSDSDGVHRGSCVSMPDVKDTTAAGDSFVASFCVGITSGLSAEDSLALASHVAAITVSRMGAIPSLPTLDEAVTLMKERNFDGFDMSKLDSLR